MTREGLRWFSCGISESKNIFSLRFDVADGDEAGERISKCNTLKVMRDILYIDFIILKKWFQICSSHSLVDGSESNL